MRLTNYSAACHACLGPCLALAILVTCVAPAAARESLDVPAPRSSTNAAIHYQRAILFLSGVDPAKRSLLMKPIWEVVTPNTSPAELAAIDDLLIDSRHAIRSALVGAHQTQADFGLDIRQYIIASYMPHTDAMASLGRLVVLHGLKHQSNGEWRDAVQSFLFCMRMGKHMSHQTTLAEAVSGVEILESAYFALGHWAVRCPDKALVEETLNIMNAASRGIVNPARTMRFEASVAKMRLDAMQDAFPDGAWAEMVLESLGAEFPSGDASVMRAKAIEAAAKYGVPKEAFSSKETFARYMTKMRSTYVALAKESANCLTFHSPRSIEEGAKVFAKYQDKLLSTERSSALNPEKIASFFAVHQAEIDLLRLVLAISTDRTPDGFPANLDGLQERLGRDLPTSPYDGSAYRYKLLEDGKGFSIGVPAAEVAGLEMPAINFHYLPAESAE